MSYERPEYSTAKFENLVYQSGCVWHHTPTICHMTNPYDNLAEGLVSMTIPTGGHFVGVENDVMLSTLGGECLF